MSDFTNSKKSRQIAEAAGLKVVVPKSNQITLDIDDDAAFATFKDHLKHLENFLETSLYWQATESRNGGKHIYIDFGSIELSTAEKIALQCILGSDLKREMNSLFRLWAEDPDPILLFEVKDAEANQS